MRIAVVEDMLVKRSTVGEIKELSVIFIEMVEVSVNGEKEVTVVFEVNGEGVVVNELIFTGTHICVTGSGTQIIISSPEQT